MKRLYFLLLSLLPLFAMAQTRQTGGISFTPQFNYKISGSDTTWQFGNTLMSPAQFPYFLTKWQSDQRYIMAGGGGYALLAGNNIFTGTNNTFNNRITVGDLTMPNLTVDGGILVTNSIGNVEQSLLTINDLAPAVTYTNSTIYKGDGTTTPVVSSLTDNGSQVLTTEPFRSNQIITSDSYFKAGNFTGGKANLITGGSANNAVVNVIGSGNKLQFAVDQTVKAEIGTDTSKIFNKLKLANTVTGSVGDSLLTLGAGQVVKKIAGNSYQVAGSYAPTFTVTAPITYSSNVIGISQSTTSTNGYLSSTDWNTFNGKQAAITFGTGVQTALGVNVGSPGAFVVNGGAGGTPSSLTLTNATGLPYSGLTGTVPTWNQNTTGSAATLTTARTIWGQSFNGSANISGAISGATTIAASGGYTQTGTGVNTFSGATNINEMLSVRKDGVTSSLIRNDQATTILNNAFPALSMVNANGTDNDYAVFAFSNQTNGGFYASAIYNRFIDNTNKYGELGFMTRASDGFLPRLVISSPGDATFSKTLTVTGLTGGSAGNFVVNGGSGLLVTRTAAQVLSDIGALSTSGNAATATKLATGRTLSITGDLAYTSPSFDGSGNVTAAGTLATVNSNVGTFNNVTVNGKGLVTAASNVAYGTGSVTSITPGYGFTSSTPITTSGTMTIDTTLITSRTRWNTTIGGAVATALATKNSGTGTANEFSYYTGANTQTSTSYLRKATASGYTTIGVGQGTPGINDTPGDAPHLFEINNDNTNQQVFKITSAGSSLAGQNNFHWNVFRGTFAAPSQTLNGDYFMSMGYRGLDNAATITQSILAFQAQAVGNITTSQQNAKFIFQTTPTGTTPGGGRRTTFEIRPDDNVSYVPLIASNGSTEGLKLTSFSSSGYGAMYALANSGADYGVALGTNASVLNGKTTASLAVAGNTVAAATSTGLAVTGTLGATLPAYSSGTNLPVVYNSTNSRFETGTSAARSFAYYNINAGTLNTTANTDYVINAAPAAVNLPDVTTTTAGAWITIKNRTITPITITALTNQIYSTATVTTYSLVGGAAVTFMPDGAGYWNVE